MGLKSKVFAAAATLTLVGGVSTVGMLSAAAATPSCGGTCVDIFSREFGTHRTPNFVLDVWRQGAKVGQPIILFRTSDTDPAEDINASFQGLTSDFFGAGLVSSAQPAAVWRFVEDRLDRRHPRHHHPQWLRAADQRF